jgi:uncharacterized protein (TIGR00730 family)
VNSNSTFAANKSVSVFCSSAPDIPANSLQLAFDVGAAIAKSGWNLIWGGGKASMMGEVAKGARAFGGKTIGVIPTSLKTIEFADEAADELHVVEDMRTRKAKLENLSDAFIALPGGIGTLEEFFEIWVGRYLNFHGKPIAVCDPFGYYTPLKQALAHLDEHNFMKSGQWEHVDWCSSIDLTISSLEKKLT